MLRAVCLLVIAVLRGWHCTQRQAEREAHCADIYNSMQYINVITPKWTSFQPGHRISVDCRT
jgi:hypothetical protein